MSTTLKLDIDEYEKMIASGAFDHINKRIEFIRGELKEMSPAGPIHDDYICFLMTWSARYIESGEIQPRCQMGIQIKDSVPEPDLAWLVPRRYGKQRPTAEDVLLVVEVAETSLEYDLGAKALLYAAGGVPEYWVINIAERNLHRHRNPSASGFNDKSILTDCVVSPSCIPSAELNLTELFRIR